MIRAAARIVAAVVAAVAAAAAAAALVSSFHCATADTLSGTVAVHWPVLFCLIFVPDIQLSDVRKMQHEEFTYTIFTTSLSMYGQPSVRKIRNWIIHLILVNVNSLHLENNRKKWLVIIKICSNLLMSGMMPCAFKMTWPLLPRFCSFLKFILGVVFNYYIFV